MPIDVRVEPAESPLPTVDYRWDTDTDILTATVQVGSTSAGMSGSVEVEGQDGSWLIFDVHAGGIRGIEVAVWPDVRKLNDLAPPAEAAEGRVTIPSRRSQPGLAAVEVDTRLTARSDRAERVIHFRIGASRATRAIRVAQDLVLEIDDRDRIAGVWFLNVPPFPDAK